MAKKKKKKRIRPLALCIFQREDKIFVSKGYDAVLDETFYRPIGGKIEFGEYGHETVAREVMEEISAEVVDVTYLDTLENIFIFDGRAGHEVVLIYDGQFVDDTLNGDDIVIQGTDDDNILFDAMWKPLDFFRAEDSPPLYPNGLLELLATYRKNKQQVINQGDIYWVHLDDPSVADAKIPHPYVVIQDNLLNHSRIKTVVACALTSNTKRTSIAGNVLLDADEANLPKRSIVEVSKVSTINKNQLGDYIGSLNEDRIAQILAGLRFQQVSFLRD
jgi:mRNA interferase MazF